MPIGNGRNHLCLIHKTLIYKTLKSLIKCTSEVSAWGIKGEACIHRISSTTAQEWDPTSVTVPVPAHAEVPSRFLRIPLHGSEKLPRAGRGRYLISTWGRHCLIAPVRSHWNLCGTCHYSNDWSKLWDWEDLKESQASRHHTYQVTSHLFFWFLCFTSKCWHSQGSVLELLVF